MKRKMSSFARSATLFRSLSLVALLAGPATAAAQDIPLSVREVSVAQTEQAPVGSPVFMRQAVGAKSAGTAALFSVLITGGGQFYNEETTKGVVMLTSSIAFAALAIGGIDEYGCDPDEVCYPWMLPTGLVGELAIKVWSIVDAAAGARRFNESQKLGSLSLQPTVLVGALGGRTVRVGVRGTF